MTTTTRLDVDWYPERLERVFVPDFRCYGQVIDICPRLLPLHRRAQYIMYLVELDVTHVPGHHLDVRTGELSLFFLEELRPAALNDLPETCEQDASLKRLPEA